jgi:hypothetical protein
MKAFSRALVVAAETVHDAPLSAATTKRAFLTVRNQASTPQAFILYPSPPTFLIPSGEPEGGVHYSVYQASRNVAAITGSYTFALPSGPPLLWADLFGEPNTVVAVTGRTREVPNEGVKLFTSDYIQLATRETMRRKCIMTMPEKDEPRFKTEKEVGAGGVKIRTPMEDGAIAIQVANTFDASHPGTLLESTLFQTNAQYS